MSQTYATHSFIKQLVAKPIYNQKEWLQGAASGGNLNLVSAINEKDNVKCILVTSIFISTSGAAGFLNLVDIAFAGELIFSVNNVTASNFQYYPDYVIEGQNINWQLTGGAAVRCSIGFIRISEEQ